MREMDWVKESEELIAPLTEMFPFDAPAWKQWMQRRKAQDLSGQWQMAGYQPGVGYYTGTVTFEVASAVEEIKAGKVEYRNDAGGNVHVLVGKQSFEAKKLVENIDAFVPERIVHDDVFLKDGFIGQHAFIIHFSIRTDIGIVFLRKIYGIEIDAQGPDGRIIGL